MKNGAKNFTEIEDDRVNARIGLELKRRLEEKSATEAGNPKVSQLVRRYIALGLKHEEECGRIRK